MLCQIRRPDQQGRLIQDPLSLQSVQDCDPAAEYLLDIYVFDVVRSHLAYICTIHVFEQLPKRSSL